MEEIRRLIPDDMADVASLEACCFPSFWKAEQFVEAWRQDWFAGYGFFRDSNLLGYITLRVLAGELEVLNIAMSPEARGNGYSFPLMEFALRDTLQGGHLQAKGLPVEGWRTAFLEVRVSNAPALALYSRLGFQYVGLRRHYYADGEDALVMRLMAEVLESSLTEE